MGITALITLALCASAQGGVGHVRHDFQGGRLELEVNNGGKAWTSSDATDDIGWIAPSKLRSFDGEGDNELDIEARYLQLVDKLLDGLSSPLVRGDMVLKNVDDEDQQAPGSGGGWGLPSMERMKSLASSAYSSLPSKDTLASYLPESVQPYLPSANTLLSYLPSMEYMAANIPESVKNSVNPKQYLSQKFLGGMNVDKLLSPDESEKLVGAMSDKILNKDGAKFDDVVQEVGQNVAQRAVENSVPLMIRLVVHRIVYGMVVNSVGPVAAFLVKNKIAQVADAIAEKAIEQYTTYDGPYKVDVLSYMRKVDWVAIAKSVVKMAKNSLSAEGQQQQA